MGNFKNTFIEALGYLSNVNNTNAYQPQNSTYNVTANDQQSFATMMAQLNNNIHNASLNSSMNSYGYNKYNFNPVSTNQTMITPNINAIAQKIKDSTSDIVDIDSQVSEYLLENYGGSKLGVIMNLSGTQNIPIQAITMQDQVFKDIVIKLASQVREDIYSSQSSSSYSLYYSDDTSEEDTSDIESYDFTID
ncbi:MAG TPA: hypothetical protein DDX14_03040 [Cyanobacteria bacterium UBA9579]|nr:hypothetical protein [Cyanobacteria bacterium UBA9579]